MASTKMSSSKHNSRRSVTLNVKLKRKAWLLGKFFANNVTDEFSADKAAQTVRFGKALETTLKLSENGLSRGDKSATGLTQPPAV